MTRIKLYILSVILCNIFVMMILNFVGMSWNLKMKKYASVGYAVTE